MDEAAHLRRVAAVDEAVEQRQSRHRVRGRGTGARLPSWTRQEDAGGDAAVDEAAGRRRGHLRGQDPREGSQDAAPDEVA